MGGSVSNRVHYENEEAIANALGDAMAEMAWPGVFAGGKQIIATQSSKAADFDVISFKFSDGSEMNIVGKFEVRYKQPTTSQKQDLIEHGQQLMSGQLTMDEGVPYREDDAEE